MNPLTTPLIRLQQMDMDDVVLLTTETSTGLGTGLIKINYMQYLEQKDRGLCVCARLHACLPAVMLMVTGELSMKDCFSVRTAKW